MRQHLIRGGLGMVLLLGAAACGGGDDGPTGPPPPTTGTISGAVTSAGTGVAGATVAMSGATNQTTNASGQFTFNNVAAGSHTLTLTVPQGYELDSGQTAAKSTTVTAGQTARVDWSLRQPSGPPPQQVTVQMNSASFDPSEVSIARGGTVRWINAAPVAHTITPSNSAQPGAWTSQNVPGTQGFTFTHTFNTAGTFDYSCSIHSGMTGTVTVQ